MNSVTSFVTIVSLLLALAVAGSAAKEQANVNSSASVRGTTASYASGGCEDWGCGTNHNETTVRDLARLGRTFGEGSE